MLLLNLWRVVPGSAWWETAGTHLRPKGTLTRQQG